VFTTIWKILQWPIALIFVLATFNLIYNFAPNIRHRQRRVFPVGAFVGVALWLLVSFGFRIYLHYFNSYSVTYGSLGALIDHPDALVLFHRCCYPHRRRNQLRG
jgi:membrane protein